MCGYGPTMASTLADADMDVHVVNEPSCTGEDALAVSFLPNAPLLLSPQVHKVPSGLITNPVLVPIDVLFQDDHQSVKVPICIGPAHPCTKVL